MTFSDWLKLINQAGADLNGIDPNWIQHQYNSQISPAHVAQAIKSGAAPRIPNPQYPPQQHQPQFQQQHYQPPQTDASKAFTYGCFGFSGALVASILIPLVLVLLLCGGCFACGIVGTAATGGSSSYGK